MTKKKSKIYKKKGNVVKDLTKNIFRILNEDSSKVYNHKHPAKNLLLKAHSHELKLQCYKTI